MSSFSLQEASASQVISPLCCSLPSPFPMTHPSRSSPHWDFLWEVVNKTSRPPKLCSKCGTPKWPRLETTTRLKSQAVAPHRQEPRESRPQPVQPACSIPSQMVHAAHNPANGQARWVRAAARNNVVFGNLLYVLFSNSLSLPESFFLSLHLS